MKRYESKALVFWVSHLLGCFSWVIFAGMCFLRPSLTTAVHSEMHVALVATAD